MYSVAVQRDLIAQHYLIGGDWGAENEKHSHHYRIELQLSGRELNQHGYMVDIVEIEAHLDALVDYFRDRTLNDLSEFKELNPSIERFSQILCHQLTGRIKAANVLMIKVKIWENEIAWASYQVDRQEGAAGISVEDLSQ
jgi:6-pyruvoyltetrahydropterin/6-carboxytetrahydropterin synthase